MGEEMQVEAYRVEAGIAQPREVTRLEPRRRRIAPDRIVVEHVHAAMHLRGLVVGGNRRETRGIRIDSAARSK